MNVNHIETKKLEPPLVDADWWAFYHALYKGIEGEDWAEMYDSYKAMSKALGFKKAAGGPERKSPVGHESSQGQFYDPSREGHHVSKLCVRPD